MVRSDDDLVTIAKYGSPLDAQVSRIALEGQGIRACVTDDETTGWLWYLGTALGGAKLQVANRDVELAQDVLANARRHDESPDSGDWICPDCRAEVDAGFDVCWSCERPRDSNAMRVGAGQTADAKASALETANGQSTDVAQPSDADANAVRAFRASVLGILIPPLTIYAAYLGIKCIGQELSPSAKRKYYAALAICVVYATFYALVIAQG